MMLYRRELLIRAKEILEPHAKQELDFFDNIADQCAKAGYSGRLGLRCRIEYYQEEFTDEEDEAYRALYAEEGHQVFNEVLFAVIDSLLANNDYRGFYRDNFQIGWAT